MLREEGFRLVFRHSVSDGEIHQQTLFNQEGWTSISQGGLRRRPLRWAADTNPDHFFFMLNARGTWLVRQGESGPVNVVLPRSVLVATDGVALNAMMARGEQHQHIFSWPIAGYSCFTKLWQGSRTQDQLRRGCCVAACPTGSIAGELFDQVHYWSRAFVPTALPKIQAAVLYLCAEALSQDPSYILTGELSGSYPEPIMRLIQAVRKSPVESWALRDAASFAGYSPFHLSRTFKALTGYGFPEFVERCRTERAIQTMLESTEQIDDISSESGFSSSQGLRDAFREYLGLLPSEFRAFLTEGSGSVVGSGYEL